MDNPFDGLDVEHHRIRSIAWFRDPEVMGSCIYDTPTGSPYYGADLAMHDELGPEVDIEGRDYTGDPIDESLVIGRVLPEGTYVPVDFVLAQADLAYLVSRPLDVSYMEMTYLEERGAPVPLQQHLRGALVQWIADDGSAFGLCSPEAPLPIEVRTDCVTDVALVLDLPTPLSAAELAAERRAADEHNVRGCQVDG